MTSVSRSQPRWLQALARPTLSRQLMVVGVLMTVVFVAIAVGAPRLESWGWLQNPQESLINPIHEPPSTAHWFGTSRQGYDVFSRTLFATRAALQVVVVATLMSMLIGVPLGLVSGYLGGRLDRSLVFLMDTI
ncbi:MAG: ABC transporter permease, partial [Spirulinaceae cyanobacterium RM2_2_10]|nr:ABC transporter permease [Spirulinaceae cyanobacterium RM2_2_10]